MLIERIGSDNLEGVDELPDKMKPPPSQRPTEVVTPPESSEEVRLLLAQVVSIMVASTLPECFRAYLDDLINILRTLAMDPFGEVIKEACAAIQELCTTGTELLFHFTVIICRSLLLALVHKHAKVRMAGLDALQQGLYCGVWKYNVDVFEILVGFRDPNLVPIRDFFEATTRVNYLAMFVVDHSTVVREHFYKTVAHWLTKLPDKRDHEGRIFPYMLSALNDEHEPIQQMAFELIEEMGELYEEEEEEKLREYKQFGYHEVWTQEGRMSHLPLPFPFLHRPRIGSRHLVRSYVRRYLKALYKELTDWIEKNRERAALLLLNCIAYSEDYMTQYLDHLLVALYKVVLEADNPIVMQRIPICLKLLGRFCTPESYGTLMLQAVRSELAAHIPFTQLGAVKSVGYVLRGTIETIVPGDDLRRVEPFLQEFFTSVRDHILPPLDFELAGALVTSIEQIVEELLSKKRSDGVDVGALTVHEWAIFEVLVRAMGVFNVFRISGKAESDAVL